jgi:hypothetical protein
VTSHELARFLLANPDAPVVTVDHFGKTIPLNMNQFEFHRPRKGERFPGNPICFLNVVVPDIGPDPD